MGLNALKAIDTGLDCIEKYSKEKIEKASITMTSEALKKIFEEDIDFRKKIKSMDDLIDKTPYLLSLREYCFDLLLVDFLGKASDKFGEDFLESPEWNKIEDETIERGTELLNVLLYLKECDIEKLEPELGDFLVEFLLVEEEEFQEEHGIYEDIIVNQMLMESSFAEIARINTSLSDDSEVKEIFYPLMSYFLNTSFDENQFKEMIEKSTQKTVDAFIVGSLIAYKS